MTLLGMDIELVESTATQLDTRAADITQTAQQLTGLIDTAVAQWFGADAQQFAQVWNTQHRPALLAAGQALTMLAAAARRNADEQRNASSATSLTAANSAPPSAGAPGAAATCVTTEDGLLRSCPATVSSGHTPTSVSGLLGLVRSAYTQPGGVAVTFAGTGADRQAIVSVSGTEDWSFGGTNPDDMSTNVGNAFAAHTLKQEAISSAMTQAGVTGQDHVLLVGHSQGGADVIDFAADPANAARYDIRGVVTAGAPETLGYPRPSVPVFELRTDGDVVPALGATSAAGLAAAGVPGAVVAHALHDAAMPDNVHVVNLPGEYEAPWDAHALDNYVSDARLTPDPGLHEFVRTNPGFFTGAPAMTYTYAAHRLGNAWHRYE